MLLQEQTKNEKNPQDGGSREDGEVQEEAAEDAEADSGNDCMLCYGPLTKTTATPCGHLFCWNCIHTSVKIKPECPSCRELSPPQTLILINNMP